jgi:hypothetical protein
VQARNARGERIPLASVESTDLLDHGGVPCCLYEVSQRGSPNLVDPCKNKGHFPARLSSVIPMKLIQGMHVMQVRNERGERIPLASVESADVLDHRGALLRL